MERTQVSVERRDANLGHQSKSRDVPLTFPRRYARLRLQRGMLASACLALVQPVTPFSMYPITFSNIKRD